MFIKNKTKKHKGSVLVFSMIMLSMILMSALAIGAATVIERKNSITSSKSTQGFQVADTGIEIITKKIREAAASQSIALATGKTCNGGNNAYVTDSTIGTSNSIYFFTDATASTPASCTTSTAGNIQSLKAVGTYSTTTRAVQAPVRNHQAAVLDSGPVSYWKMDESNWPSIAGAVIDSDTTLPANNGTAFGGANTTNTDGNYKFGIYGGSFDGTDDYISVPDSASLRITAYTVELWIKPNGVPNETWKGLIGKPGRNFNIWLNSSGYIHHRFHTTSNSNEGIPNTPDGSIIWDTWNYVAITNDGTTAKTYINGVEKASGPVNGTLVVDNTIVYIGRNLDGSSGNYFNGKIDEVAIYSRALSQSEIQSHR